MLYLPNDKMFPNKFIEVQIPSKGQIFARTGQRAQCGGSYTGEDGEARFASSKTQSAERFVRNAESFETPKDEK